MTDMYRYRRVNGTTGSSCQYSTVPIINADESSAAVENSGRVPYHFSLHDVPYVLSSFCRPTKKASAAEDQEIVAQARSTNTLISRKWRRVHVRMLPPVVC